LYRNARPNLKTFFANFSAKNAQKEKQDGALSFSLLMSNFRRKKIIDTLKNYESMKYEDRQELLQPYQELIQS